MSADVMYFVIYSNTSRNGVAGQQPRVMGAFRSAIVDAARRELLSEGMMFEDLIGIERYEDEHGRIEPVRELTPGEVFDLSVQKLSDDGRLFIVFEADSAGAAAFVAEAETYGLADKARAVVEYFTA